MIDGSCCQLCGQYFEDPDGPGIYVHDYPVICWDCWDDLTNEEKRDYQKAIVKTF
jgi:hypothetical protein